MFANVIIGGHSFYFRLQDPVLDKSEAESLRNRDRHQIGTLNRLTLFGDSSLSVLSLVPKAIGVYNAGRMGAGTYSRAVGSARW